MVGRTRTLTLTGSSRKNRSNPDPKPNPNPNPNFGALAPLAIGILTGITGLTLLVLQAP